MTTLTERRRNLIEALKSGNHRQGYGALIKSAYRPDPLFCCLGLAREMSTPGWAATIAAEDDSYENYSHVRRLYEIDFKMSTYMIAMNDGMFVQIGGAGNAVHTVTDLGLLIDRRKTIRNTDDRRDFKYIARFLEIAWKMSSN